MRIRLDCIVAYGPSVNMQRGDINDHGVELIHMLFHRYKFVTLTGPGLVYIDMQVGSRFFKRDQMALFAVALYFLLYLLMFLIFSFDRRLQHLVQDAP